MDVFVGGGDVSGHEQVIFCHDRTSGLRAVIALYSTALGPGLGGTRFYPYRTENEAVADVLRLSRAMAYKNAMAGLDFGGGKAVIWGDPRTDKNEMLLRAYGRFVESLAGRYVTACDVGTYVRDMDVVARETTHVVGRSAEHGGAGDSSILTAYGVFVAMQAAAAHRWGSRDLAGKRVGVDGVGKVGSHLVSHLVDAGATVTITDVNPDAIERIVKKHYDVSVVDPGALHTEDLDIYSPCALGGVLSERTVGALRCEIVCGGANNQLSEDSVAELLSRKGVCYTPDYVVNAGGVIQVADELEGFSFDRAKARTSHIYDITQRILTLSEESGVTTVAAANRLAEQRMSDVIQLHSIYLP